MAKEPLVDCEKGFYIEGTIIEAIRGFNDRAMILPNPAHL